MRAAIALACLWSFSAAAEELPTNLLLKCEGMLTVIMGEPTIDSMKPTMFATILRLQNGELADTRSFFLNTGNCKLRNAVVSCTGQANYPSTIDSGSESREMKSYINRETGEYNFFMETTSYTGRNSTGKKNGWNEISSVGNLPGHKQTNLLKFRSALV